MQKLIRGKIFKPTIKPHIISYKKNHPLLLEPILTPLSPLSKVVQY